MSWALVRASSFRAAAFRCIWTADLQGDILGGKPFCRDAHAFLLAQGEARGAAGPLARFEQLKTDAKLRVSLDTSTREDALPIDHETEKLGDKAVREALEMAIDKQAIVMP